ncbi:hypothetical protein [Frigoribacterium sp. VKM Ac-2836]|uniref:hypothetical protein n=1 Tax=Frigoribacterium sp. VKM Ac-2836 TaxID=2739014 RepID=UPI001563608E|nr:hypothetical protein [Frigoribacterium sp. VKM Ac-2836]NRD25835.1 hypothetical protein [Frigoribacterium sp. VKM Ac-2836]
MSIKKYTQRELNRGMAVGMVAVEKKGRLVYSAGPGVQRKTGLRLRLAKVFGRPEYVNRDPYAGLTEEQAEAKCEQIVAERAAKASADVRKMTDLLNNFAADMRREAGDKDE